MKKILVIEDEPSVRNNLLRLLNAEGFQALSAEDGNEGIQLAQSQAPDLILCDIMMPEMTGFDVLQVLRSDAQTNTIPFIFLTAKADRSDLRQGMLLGADDYLTKPFTRLELLAAIATRLSKHDAVTQRYNEALKTATEQLNRLAYYDSVTELPNRLLLRERFQQTLQTFAQTTVTASPTSDSPSIAILSLGLDRFQWIHHNLGFTYSDLLLKRVAERLRDCIGENDTVARLEGTQFAIILTTAAARSEMVKNVQKILNVLLHPFELDNYEVFVTPSIGIAIYGKDGEEIEKLVRNAETARNLVQSQSGLRYQFYQPKSDSVKTDRFANRGSPQTLTLETRLHYALERNEFEIFYQPKVNLKTGKLTGAEALIRWLHPQDGRISPAEFLPLAEKTGFIVEIDQWVLRTVCQQVKTWQTEGFSAVQVAVNLSGRQFNQPGITERIVEILKQTQLEPHLLEIELTESTLVKNVTAAIATLNDLKQLGIQVAIDDFGTGYSSLGYLKQFPFTTLKIDRCFVSNVTADSTSSAIAIAIIQMAQSLNLKVVAEGVETEAEKAFLAQNQCDEIQGYLISPPLPPNQFSQYLTKA